MMINKMLLRELQKNFPFWVGARKFQLRFAPSHTNQLVFLKCGSRELLLKLYPVRVTPYQKVLLMADALRLLRCKALPVHKVVVPRLGSYRGKAVQEYRYRETTYWGILYESLQGRVLLPQELGFRHLEVAVRVLYSLHEALKELKPLRGEDQLLRVDLTERIRGQESKINALAGGLVSRWRSRWKEVGLQVDQRWGSLKKQFVHGDFTQGNLLWVRDDLSGVIDFELDWAPVEWDIGRAIEVWVLYNSTFKLEEVMDLFRLRYGEFDEEVVGHVVDYYLWQEIIWQLEKEQPSQSIVQRALNLLEKKKR